MAFFGDSLSQYYWKPIKKNVSVFKLEIKILEKKKKKSDQIIQ